MKTLIIIILCEALVFVWAKKKKMAAHLLSKEKLGIVTSLLRETGEFHPPHSFVSPFSPFFPHTFEYRAAV